MRKCTLVYAGNIKLIVLCLLLKQVINLYVYYKLLELFINIDAKVEFSPTQHNHFNIKTKRRECRGR